ncbi:hypothetical protein FB107DRAFT_271863 [Schizophyllum commune]
MRLGIVDCWIEADGKPLEEYGVEVSEDGKRCTAWIPSKAGQEFVVHLRDPDLARSTLGAIYTDGHNVGGPVLEAFRSPTLQHVSRAGVNISPTEIRNFKFGEVKLTDDDTYLSQDMKSVGEVRFELWLCHVGRFVVPTVRPQITETTKMHERSKKGLAHAVAFSETKRLERPTNFVEATKLGGEPLATFTFRYRSLEMLRANGIAPMPQPAEVPRAASSTSSSPVAGPSRGRKRKATDPLTPERDAKRDVKPVIIDMDEEDEAEERIRKAEDELRRARLEMHRRRGNTKIKLEQVLPILPGEVLDLTELSD